MKYSFRSLGWGPSFLISLIICLGANTQAQQPTWTWNTNQSFAVSAPMSTQTPAAAMQTNDLDPVPGPSGTSGTAGGLDMALQTTSMPSPGIGGISTFPGVGLDMPLFNEQLIPSDSNGAVGQTQYVQWVNNSFAVFNKSDHSVALGPLPGNTLFQALGDHACAHTNDGDPIAQYDKQAKRWILMQLSRTTGSYFECVAVSTSSDATGSYNLYGFQYTDGFNDYPKLGVWNNAYYATYHMATSDSPNAPNIGPKLCAWDRAAMMAGSPVVTQGCAQLSPSFGPVLPADLDGSTPPPAGSPAIFLGLSRVDGVLYLWQLSSLNFAAATATLSAPIPLPISPWPGCATANCVLQHDTTGFHTNFLMALEDRLMYRLAYRNFGDHQSLVVNHTVVVNPGTTTAAGAEGIRWYEIRDPGGSPFIYQQGTYSPDTSTSRFFASMAMDSVGNIAVGYSVVSPLVDPGVRLTGRAPADPLNALGNELSIQEATGIQVGGFRWGDYSSMSVDPLDDCTFWYTNQFILAPDGVKNWRTAISTFKFNNCGQPAAATPTFSPAPGTYPSAQSVALADTTPNATIYYTLDGSPPTHASTQYMNTPISITATTVVKAIASAPNFVDSAVATGTYAIVAPPPAPTFSPAPGTYIGSVSVTLSDASAGASIYYTLDGSTPTTASTLYSTAINITKTTTIKAIAVANGFSSPVSSATYTIQAVAPTFSPGAGTYDPPVQVTLSAGQGASIYYTLNGTTPSPSSTPYSGPIGLTTTTTIKAIAVVAGQNNSAVSSATYTMQAATPVFSPAPGAYSNSVTVSISDSTAGVTIRYTLDGSTPTSTSTPYSGPLTISMTTTVKAIAFAPAGVNNSAVASATYTITHGPPSVSGISPTTGTTAGGTAITITGTGFLPGATVRLGTGTASNVNVVNATQITALSPSQPAGTVNLTVTNPDGQASSLVNAYTYFLPQVWTSWAKPSSASWGPANTLTTGGTAFGGSGTVQLVWRDVTLNGPWNTVAAQSAVDSSGNWWNTVPSSNYCHTFSMYGNYLGISSSVFTYVGLGSAYCNENAWISWIQPQSSAGFGPPGSLVLAGNATGAPAGSTVVVWWSDVTAGTGWHMGGSSTPDSTGFWSNSVPNVNYSHQYSVYVVYDAFNTQNSQGVCTYAGNGSITYCPR